jgi:TPR repeat protein
MLSQIWLLVIIAFIALIETSSSKAHAAVFISRECSEEKQAPDCEKNGSIKYIYIYDSIEMETADAVARVNGAIPIGEPFPLVYLNSEGGSGPAAYQIGRILRQRSASVESKDMFFPNRMPSCNSACALIAMGATTRNLIQVGIHQGGIYGYRRGKAFLKSENDEADLKEDWNYMDEMGMSPQLKKILEKTPHKELAEFYLDLDDPFSEQDIVKYGFRMRQPLGEELKDLKKVVLRLDENLAGLRKTAEAGNTRSAAHLGATLFFGKRGETQDTTEGLLWLDRAGDAGSTDALHLLGVIYSNGYENVRKNEARAVKYYLRAAKLGFSGSQNNLAWHYYKGHGTKKNVAEAIFWVTRSAEQGEPFAYGSLGTIRLEGNGFIRDDIETYKWLKLAMIHMPEGIARDTDRKILEKLKRRMTPAQISEGDRLAQEWRPLRKTTRVMGNKE